MLTLLRSSVRRHTGEDASEELIASILAVTRVAAVEPDGAHKPNVLALLGNVVVAERTDADGAWRAIVAKCQWLAETRSGADRTALRDVLRSSGFRLLGVPEIAADVRHLEIFTKETLSSLSHLAHTDVPTGTVVKRIEVDRSVTDALVEHSQRSSFLVIGAPGSGKSGAMYSAAERLAASGHPVVAIAVDGHPVLSQEDLRRDLRLHHSLVHVLRNWTSEKRGVLFIDALDATRGGPSDRVFQELIRRVIEEAPHWHVVASIRKFDLRFGVTYRTLFGGSPVDDDYRDSEFGGVKHLLIPRLTDQELNQVLSESPPMAEAYREGTDALQELLRSPFNLFLLANVLSAGRCDLQNVTTQVQLLHLYWSYRVIGEDQRGLAREGLLRRALERMLENRSLRVALDDDVDGESPDLYQLHSAGVLSPTEGMGDRVGRISFAHHVLFDYGVARLTLESGQAADLAARLTSSDERGLLIAPGALMALQILWQDDTDGRPTFWKKAFEVAGSDEAGAFCRMLPARTAAALTNDLQDFDPVLDCLRRSDCPARSAALFLVQHCTGALTAGVPPQPTPSSPRGAWPRVARALAEVSVADTGWMLKALVGQWVDGPALLTQDEKVDIGVTARLMLRLGSNEPYDRSMVIVGIRGVTRTLESAPAAAIESLGRLLTADHVVAHGHEELSWLARELEHILLHTPLTSNLVGEIYRAGYCTPLPSRDDATEMGQSRIFSCLCLTGEYA